ncbi:MAG TPA: metal-dependent transcriptional regulator [Candidatus Krumholzibacteria bacterium]|nr:metal-dependent transcriptional regulator [Candidatus Krumholzibacteria bacterium]
MTPAANLAVFFLGAALLGVVFWPRRGLFARGRQGRSLARRVELEDALKHVYNHDARGQTSTLESLAGALEISSTSAVALVDRMQSVGLARVADGRILLTDEGRRYALEVIRAHRLWERYLADETGIDPLEWHERAERKEHKLSREEADALSARLGDPRFDPHGDPIPTADGAVFDGEVLPLTSLAQGERAMVAHVEDEPRVVYAQLVALGVYPGLVVCVASKSEQRIEIESEGRRFVLAPLVAQNVSIRRIEIEEPAGAPVETLASLRPGEAADVVRLSPACRGIERRRLMDLGIVPGTRVQLERRGLTGGLSAYHVRGTVIGLREEQASLIGVVRREPAAEEKRGESAIRAGVLDEDMQ